MSHSRLVVPFVLIVAALHATNCAGNKQPSTVPQGGSAGSAVAAAAAVVSGIPIINGSFVVAPRTFKEFKVVVPSGARNARVEGTFSATGARNDIEVSLLEEHQFLNWQNQTKFTTTYDSGRVTAGKIRIDLPAEAATYVVVFSNRFSWLSNKAVVADLKLQYER